MRSLEGSGGAGGKPAGVELLQLEGVDAGKESSFLLRCGLALFGAGSTQKERGVLQTQGRARMPHARSAAKGPGEDAGEALARGAEKRCAMRRSRTGPRAHDTGKERSPQRPVFPPVAAARADSPRPRSNALAKTSVLENQRLRWGRKARHSYRQRGDAIRVSWGGEGREPAWSSERCKRSGVRDGSPKGARRLRLDAQHESPARRGRPKMRAGAYFSKGSVSSTNEIDAPFFSEATKFCWSLTLTARPIQRTLTILLSRSAARRKTGAPAAE